MPRVDLVLDIHFLLLLYSQLLIAIDVCTLECTHCISIHILNNKHINLHTLYSFALFKKKLYMHFA